MTAAEGMRVAVIGATGTLGTDLLRVLEARDFPLAELIPVATERMVARGFARSRPAMSGAEP